MSTDTKACKRCGREIPASGVCGACFLSAEPPAVELGDSLRLGVELGSGGMGTVFRAEHKRLGRPVAVKLLAPELASREEFRERFVREAQALAMLNHPNIVTVYDFDESDGESYIVMELVEGKSLSQVIPIGPAAAVEIACQICDALAAAHAQGIIHRDIKPGNILMEQFGRVKLTDFGIARVARASGLAGDLTNPGLPMGTPQYMAPEAIAGAAPDPRMDIYSVGVVLYEMVTGRPEPGDYSMLPAGFAAVVRRALARNPRQRYPSAAALAQDLRRTQDRDTPSRPSKPTLPLGGYPGAEQERKSNLPLPAGPLVGRAADLEGIEKELSRGRRLVTIVGPPGVGKTRLAVEVGTRTADAEDAPSGGVWFCDLTAARSIEDLCSALANTLDVRLPASTPEDAVAMLAHALAARGDSLIILDNLEQLAESAPDFLDPWIQNTRHVQFLVTSREALRIRGEHLCTVRPLPTPRPGEEPQLGGAVELFVLRVQERRKIKLDDNALEIIGSIVRRLDGLPLAVELAAARAAVLSLEQLSERLGQFLDVLRETRRGAPSRHATLRDAIAWSWSLLDYTEQRALAQASVFRDGFSLEAAETVIALGEDAPPVLDVIEALCNKSLVRTMEPDALPGTIRFGIYESVRELAAEKLRDSEEAEDTQARHCGYYLRVGEDWAASADLFGGAACRAQLALERNNLAAAYARAARHMRDSSAHAAIAIRVLLALDPMVWIQGPYGTQLALLTDALRRSPSDLDPALRVRVAQKRTRYRRARGEVAGLIGDLEHALAISREIGDRRLEAAVQCDLGLASYAEENNVAKARERLRAAIAIAQDVGDRYLEALSLLRLGAMARTMGEIAKAQQISNRARAIFRAIGAERLEAMTLTNMATMHQEIGEIDEALVKYEEGIAIQERVGDQRAQSISLANKALLHRERQEYKLSSGAYERSLRQLRSTGDRRWEAIVTGHYAGLLHELGRLDEARAGFELALERLTISTEYRGLFQGHLGAVLAGLGLLEEAEESLDAAEAHFATMEQSLRREAVSLDRGHLEVALHHQALQALELDRAAELRAAVQQRIERASTPRQDGPAPTERSDEVRLAVRLLQHALDPPV